MIEHEITVLIPLTSFGGLQSMADKARDVRDSYDGKSSAHWQAWENLRLAIEARIASARAAESAA